jgi:hypothetical protein
VFSVGLCRGYNWRIGTDRGWPGYTPRHWVPFTSPPTTHRTTMEVFDSASTRDAYFPSRVDSYVTTDGQSASLSWNKAPIWGLRHRFLLLSDSCGALSLTRGRVCRLQLLLALDSGVILGSESRGTQEHILLSQIRHFPFRRLLRLAGIRWRY